MKQIDSVINDVISRTFAILKMVYDNRYEGCANPGNPTETRLLFPRYSVTHHNGAVRVIEQELRFLFIEQFNKYCQVRFNIWTQKSPRCVTHQGLRNLLIIFPIII